MNIETWIYRLFLKSFFKKNLVTYSCWHYFSSRWGALLLEALLLTMRDTTHPIFNLTLPKKKHVDTRKNTCYVVKSTRNSNCLIG